MCVDVMRGKPRISEYGSVAVANYIIERFEYPVTNLKLNKLIYFIYGAYLVFSRGNPLFSDKPEAWLYGPVFPNVYNTFQEFGRLVIKKPRPMAGTRTIYVLSEKESMKDVFDVINSVLDHYGRMSSGKLVRITHQPESPWSKSYSRNRNNIIPDRLILDYFSKIVKFNE